MINYYYYRLGCEGKEPRPLTRLRFEIAHARYARDKDKKAEIFSGALDKKSWLRVAIRWAKLAKIDALIRRGKMIAERESPDLVPAGFGAALPSEQERDVMETPGAGRNRFYDLDSYVRPHTADGGPSADNPDAPGGTGVREPRRPIAPILIGAAAKPLPNPLPEYFDAAV